MGRLGWRCKQSLLSIIKKRIWRKNKLSKEEEQTEQNREILGNDNGKECTYEYAKGESLTSEPRHLSDQDSLKLIRPIIKQVYPSTTHPHSASQSIKKKVSIILPSQPQPQLSIVAKKVTWTAKVSKDSNHHNISPQVRWMRAEAKQHLLIQHPHIRASVELLFHGEIKTMLVELTSNEVGDLLFSLRTILFNPPVIFKDLVVSQILELLLHVTEKLQMTDLQKRCLEVSGRCRSRQFYSDTDTCWTDVQTLLVCAWCCMLEIL